MCRTRGSGSVRLRSITYARLTFGMNPIWFSIITFQRLWRSRQLAGSRSYRCTTPISPQTPVRMLYNLLQHRIQNVWLQQRTVSELWPDRVQVHLHAHKQAVPSSRPAVSPTHSRPSDSGAGLIHTHNFAPWDQCTAQLSGRRGSWHSCTMDCPARMFKLLTR